MFLALSVEDLLPWVVLVVGTGVGSALVIWLTSMAWWQNAKKKYQWLELVEKVARMGISHAEAWAADKQNPDEAPPTGAAKLVKAIDVAKAILRVERAPKAMLEDALLTGVIERQLLKTLNKPE